MITCDPRIRLADFLPIQDDDVSVRSFVATTVGSFTFLSRALPLRKVLCLQGPPRCSCNCLSIKASQLMLAQLERENLLEDFAPHVTQYFETRGGVKRQYRNPVDVIPTRFVAFVGANHYYPEQKDQVSMSRRNEPWRPLHTKSLD